MSKAKTAKETVEEPVDTSEWETCRCCQRDRRVIDGRLVVHNYYHPVTLSMHPCQGSHQPASEPLAATEEIA